MFGTIDTADGIIAYATASPENYRAMAAKESEVWGKFLTNPRVAEIRARDAAAGTELRVNRHMISFPQWCRQNHRRFARGLSIGCGAGRAERNFVGSGICAAFHGVDVSDQAIDEARKLSREAGMANSYEVADVNFAEFGESQYDLIVAQTSLHHVLYLEDVFARMHRALKPGGILWMNDYVGESQFQHSPTRVAFAETIMSIIPPEYLVNQLNSQRLSPIVVRRPGTLISPFESIRSGEILPIARRYFDTIAGGTHFSIIHLALPVGTREYYTRDAAGRALFEKVLAYDRCLIDSGILEGTSALFVMQRKDVLEA